MDNYNEQVELLSLATKKYKEAMIEISKIKNLREIPQKMIDNILESNEELYPENISLILSKFDSLSEIHFAVLENDILTINLMSEDDYFVINLRFSFEYYHDGPELNIEIEHDDPEFNIKITKIINNFRLINVKVGRTKYTKQQLMGG